MASPQDLASARPSGDLDTVVWLGMACSPERSSTSCELQLLASHSEHARTKGTEQAGAHRGAPVPSHGSHNSTHKNKHVPLAEDSRHQPTVQPWEAVESAFYG